MTAIEILPIVSFVPLTVRYLVIRRDLAFSAWRAFATGLAVPLLAHAAINVHITGDVIPAGFHTELFDYPGTGFDPKELTWDTYFPVVPMALDALGVAATFF